MTDNRKRVLQMLADGKITPDDADRLLTALGEGSGGERERASVETEVMTMEPHDEIDIELVETGNGDSHDIEEEIEEIIEERFDYGDVPRERDDVFKVGDSPHLEVRNINGRIALGKSSDGEIRVRASFKNAPRLDYEAVQDGDTVRVTVRKKGGSFAIFRSPGARLEITAPVNTTIDLGTSNGRIEVSGIEGSGPIRTTNGRITLEKARGDHEITTSNGRIEIDGMEGSGELATSNGSITVKSVIGGFNATTSNGSIHFSGELAKSSKNRFETTNGSVRVRLTGTPGLRVDAQTSNGKVTSELPVQVISSSRNRLAGTIGDGHGELVVRTSNGSVTIE
jgi:DUF4097 and DUF4098 domain-containing protein YvlB